MFLQKSCFAWLTLQYLKTISSVCHKTNKSSWPAGIGTVLCSYIFKPWFSLHTEVSSVSLSRVSGPAGAVQSRWGFSEARREALVPALPGPPHHAHRHLGQRLTAPHRFYCHWTQGRRQIHIKQDESDHFWLLVAVLNSKLWSSLTGWENGEKHILFTRVLSAHDTPSTHLSRIHAAFADCFNTSK